MAADGTQNQSRRGGARMDPSRVDSDRLTAAFTRVPPYARSINDRNESVAARK